MTTGLNPRVIVDEFLEITVAGSFTNTGFRVRQWLFGWQPPPPGALVGRTAVVTGPTSGIGRHTATELAGLGARVVLVGRNEQKLAATRDELQAVHGEDRFPVVVADMSSLRSVREAVDRVLETESRLDVLVDNAGAMFHQRELTRDGIERTLATLVVGPFALIGGLLPLLRATGGARVIGVTSGGMYAQPLDLDDLQLASGSYDGPRAYAKAKRAQVALTREWARRFKGSGVTFNVMHPGWADTPGLEEMLPGFYRALRPLLRDLDEAADTIVWLAADPAAAGWNGRLFLDRRPRPFDRIPSTRVSAAERTRLWDMIVGLTGGRDPHSG